MQASDDFTTHTQKMCVWLGSALGVFGKRELKQQRARLGVRNFNFFFQGK